MKTRTEWGIDFLDKDGELIEERPYANYVAREEAWKELQTDKRTVEEGGPWPEGAEGIRAWSRQVKLVYGVDYGPGSIKRRFGGGRVPKGAYQFRG